MKIPEFFINFSNFMAFSLIGSFLNLPYNFTFSTFLFLFHEFVFSSYILQTEDLVLYLSHYHFYDFMIYYDLSFLYYNMICICYLMSLYICLNLDFILFYSVLLYLLYCFLGWIYAT
jgi:hypothetical protein